MELLTPQKVDKDKKARTEEQGRIAHNAAVESARSIKRLNNAKDAEAREQQKRDADALKVASKAELRRDELLGEVGTLEKRREEALKPITEMKNAAEILMRDVEGRFFAVSQRENAVAEREESVGDKLEQIETIKEDLRGVKESLDAREKGIKASESVLKRSTEELSNKWFEYNAAVSLHNREMTERETFVILSAKANEIARLENVARTSELNAMERGIRDRYDVMLEVERQQKKKYDKR